MKKNKKKALEIIMSRFYTPSSVNDEKNPFGKILICMEDYYTYMKELEKENNSVSSEELKKELNVNLKSIKTEEQAACKKCGKTDNRKIYVEPSFGELDIRTINIHTFFCTVDKYAEGCMNIHLPKDKYMIKVKDSIVEIRYAEDK